MATLRRASSPGWIGRAPDPALAYTWLHDGEPAGTVELTIVADPSLGTRIELEHTIPHRLAGLRATVLAAWHTYFEQLFAALFGDIRCPWPSARTDELIREYADRLASG